MNQTTPALQNFDIRQTLPLPPCILHEDAPLLQLSDLPQDAWTLRDAYEGVQVFGGTGSGKSSGSGRALAHAFLRSGMGGLVLCAKEDEAGNWRQHAVETGRGTALRVFSPDNSEHCFNFLEYEMRRNPANADLTISNVVSLLLNTLDVAARGTSLTTAASGSDPFWAKASKMMLGGAVRLLYATYGTIRLPEIMELLETAPKSPEQRSNEAWQKSSFFARTLREFYATGGGRFPPDLDDLHQLKQFWMHGFPSIPEKTRGNILTTIRADLEPLLQGRMRRIFCGDTTIVPEFTHDGAVIVLDFPTKIYGDVGVLAQQIFKYAWQRATEARRITETTRPVFLFADECQFFMSGYDMEFQSTARSARACTVLMTQNLSTYYSRMGGSAPEHTVNAMLGNLRTKIFHTNADHATNEWAAKMVGKETFWRETYGYNSGWSDGSSSGTNQGRSDGWTNSSGNGQFSHGQSGGFSSGQSESFNSGSSGGSSRGVSEQRDYAVEPEDFARDLLSGGKRDNFIVTGVIMEAGRKFSRNRKHWMQVAFRQR